MIISTSQSVETAEKVLNLSITFIRIGKYQFKKDTFHFGFYRSLRAQYHVDIVYDASPVKYQLQKYTGLFP